MLPLSMKLLAPVLAALVLMPPPAGAAEMKEVACKETLLCSEVTPEDAALFDRYFGTAAAPVAEGWDAENLVQFSSSWHRNKAGKQVLCERLMILAEDGSTLRKLFCERFETNPAKRVNYKELKYRAVVPFVFAYNLVGIVDFDDETLYVDCVHFNPQTRSLEGIESKHWSRRELHAMRGDLTEEDKSLFDTCFPRHKRRRTPPTWDAGQRVLYSARGRTGPRGAYALNGCLKRIAADGSSCRLAVKTLETKGAWICRDRPRACELPMVVPFVFVELSDKLRFLIEQCIPRSGAYEGSRIREYDFRSLKLVNDAWTPAAPSN